jgi:hypothetical protein
LKDQMATFNELPLIQATGWSFTGFRGDKIQLTSDTL